jgi:putative redox protein
MRTLRYRFDNRNGHQLSARLDLPADGRPAAYALFAHCFTGTKNLNAVRHISRALLSEDIAVFRFDFTGLGESEGDFAETNFSSNVHDLADAAAFMARQGMPPQLLIGHSLGGAAAIMAAPHIPSAKALATLGTPSDPAHVQHQFEAHIGDIEREGQAKVTLGGRPFFIQRQFLRDLEAHDLPATLRRLGKALLIMHAPQDTTVAIAHAAHLYNGAKHPKSFVSLDGADHLLTREADSRYAGQVIASWAARYLDRREDVLPETKRQVVVQSEGEYFADVVAGPFRLGVDLPPREGGHGAAPSPRDLVLAGLGGAVSAELRRWAVAQGLALRGVRVHLEWPEIGPLHLLAEVWGALPDTALASFQQALGGLKALQWLAVPIHAEVRHVG